MPRRTSTRVATKRPHLVPVLAVTSWRLWPKTGPSHLVRNSVLWLIGRFRAPPTAASPEAPQHLAVVAGVDEDLVLRPEPCERRHPGDRQPGHDEGARGDRHPLAEPAHALHVLLVAQAVHDRAGPEEQEGLEEGVG